MPKPVIDIPTRMGERTEDAVRSVLRATPLIDGHNDLPWALRELLGERVLDRLGEIDLTQDLASRYPDLQTDFARAARGGLGAQFWSVYVPCSFTGADAVTAVLEQIELTHELIARYPERLAFAGTAAEVRQAFDSGRIAALLGAEGGHCIDGSLGVLRALHRLGVRYLTLTHNENTTWADSATDTPEHGGLTEFGRSVVAEMNELGMLVDLSHVAESTMRDAIAASRAPVIFSHSSAKAVTDSPRNVPDDVLRSTAAQGGVCMVSFVPQFVSTAVAEWGERVRAAMDDAGAQYTDLEQRQRFIAEWDGPAQPRATLDDVLAHIEHVREVAGVDHIGLGGDYDGVAVQPEELGDVTGYPKVFAALAERGWSHEELGKLAGQNLLRVLGDAESVAADR